MGDSCFDLHLADARNLIDVLDSKDCPSDLCVNAIVTSPPYADVKDYGGEGQIGQQPYDKFLEDLRQVFSQCYDITSNDATLWLIVDEFKRDDRIIRFPDDIADTLENLPGRSTCDDCDTLLSHRRVAGDLHCTDCGRVYSPREDSWTLSEHIIWDKKRTLPWTKKGLRNVHEHVLVFAKSDDYQFNVDNIRVFDTDELSRWWVGYPERFNPKGKIPGNIWEHDIPKQGQWGPKVSTHPSPLPYSLLEQILRVATEEGDVVLDPFAGVGTTLAVADVMDRKGIGFEINEEYLDVYNEYIRHDARENLSQSTDGREEMLDETRRKIWTLRAHKYGFQLCKALKELNDGRSAVDMGVNTVFVLVDNSTMPPDSDSGPKVNYVFALDGDSDLSGSGPIDAAADHIKGGGSGGYYGLEAHFTTVLSGLLLGEIENNKWVIDSDTELHVYIGGHHNWCVRDTRADGWLRDYGTQKWDRLTKNGYPPLLSTEHIQIEDESKSSGPPQLDTANQLSVTKFSQRLD